MNYIEYKRKLAAGEMPAIPNTKAIEKQAADDATKSDIIDMLCKILADEYVSYYAYFAGAKNIRGEN